MKKLLDVSLETKISGILIGIITLVVIAVASFILYDYVQEYYDNAERLSLQSAKTISFLPSLVDSQDLNEDGDIQTIANQYIFDNDIDFVIIKDNDGNILTHPDSAMIGELEAYDEDVRAKVFGAYYTYETEEYGEPAIVSVAPIYSVEDYKQINGVVKAGYFKSAIKNDVMDKVYTLLTIVVVFILLSLLISKLFSLYIKSETLGYEPKEITTLLKNRENIFSSLGEGIIATDLAGNITYLNQSAQTFLSVTGKESFETTNIFSLLTSELRDKIQNEEQLERYYETSINDKEIVILVNQLYEKGETVGQILILRDMTRMAELTNKLTIVESLFDDLRAQSHEYKNKLHLISGLLEMEKFNQIREVLNEELNHFDFHSHSLSNIKEDRIKALLLAKMNKASEKRVEFNIDKDSQLDNIIHNNQTLNSLIIIISNLIDNAMEAVVSVEYPKVSFYIGHFDGWLEIVVEDNGEGFRNKEKIFEKGYSTKDNNNSRGYGLYNVVSNVEILNGYVDVSNYQGKTRFTVEVPFLSPEE